MPSKLKQFETVALALARAVPFVGASVPEPVVTQPLHPFDTRNIHPKLPSKVRKLFDDGHFAEATSHAFKYLDKQVEKLSGLSDSGFSLMMDAFDSKKPKNQAHTAEHAKRNGRARRLSFCLRGEHESDSEPTRPRIQRGR